MTRIDFYVLPETGDALTTACKLCDKATASGQRVYVYSADEQLADDFDGALWSFRQGGFIAHERYDGEPLDEPLPSVLIGAVEPPPTHQDVLVNLDLAVPPFFSRFERVLELVSGDAAQRARSRERFKFYRDRGYELKTHNL